MSNLVNLASPNLPSRTHFKTLVFFDFYPIELNSILRNIESGSENSNYDLADANGVSLTQITSAISRI